MKNRITVVLVFVLLLAWGSVAHAQTSTPTPEPTRSSAAGSAQTSTPTNCEWSLTQIYARLANAQVAWEIGNAKGALDAASEAREALDRLVAQCTGQVATPVKSGGIALYLGDSTRYSKLETLAWANGIDLRVAQDPGEFQALLQKPDVATAVSVAALDDTTLLSLDKFAQAGGKLVLLYERRQKNSPLYQNLFGFSVVDETLSTAEGSYQLDNSMLPPWLSGMRIGWQGKNQQLNLPAYLVFPGTEGLQRSLQSEASARSRVVVYESPSGRLVLLPSVMGCTWSDTRGWTDCRRSDWFDNANIDYFDNEAAALAMLRYLSSDRTAPGTPSSQSDQRPPQLTDAHVERFEAIQQQVATGKINKAQADKDLVALAGEIGKDAFAWLVRNIPLYNTETKQWQSVDAYMKEFATDSGVEPASRLARDPVGTAVDLVFGNPSSDDIRDWLGFGD